MRIHTYICIYVYVYKHNAYTIYMLMYIYIYTYIHIYTLQVWGALPLAAPQCPRALQQHTAPYPACYYPVRLRTCTASHTPSPPLCIVRELRQPFSSLHKPRGPKWCGRPPPGPSAGNPGPSAE